MRKITRIAAKGIILAIFLLLSLTGCADSGPTTSNIKNINETTYGTVDWSTAAQGYITFTAKSQERHFILQGPNDTQVLLTVQKDEAIRVPLIDGTGRYQYAITNLNPDGKALTVQYKNSFHVSKIDYDLEL